MRYLCIYVYILYVLYVYYSVLFTNVFTYFTVPTNTVFHVITCWSHSLSFHCNCALATHGKCHTNRAYWAEPNWKRERHREREGRTAPKVKTKWICGRRPHETLTNTEFDKSKAVRCIWLLQRTCCCTYVLSRVGPVDAAIVHRWWLPVINHWGWQRDLKAAAVKICHRHWSILLTFTWLSAVFFFFKYSWLNTE